MYMYVYIYIYIYTSRVRPKRTYLQGWGRGLPLDEWSSGILST